MLIFSNLHARWQLSISNVSLTLILTLTLSLTLILGNWTPVMWSKMHIFQNFKKCVSLYYFCPPACPTPTFWLEIYFLLKLGLRLGLGFTKMLKTGSKIHIFQKFQKLVTMLIFFQPACTMTSFHLKREPNPNSNPIPNPNFRELDACNVVKNAYFSQF